VRPQTPMGSLRPIIVLASAIFLLLGLMVIPAHANTPPPCDNDHAYNDGLTWTDEWGFKYECKSVNGQFGWYLVPFPGEKEKSQLFVTSNPSSRQIVSSGFRVGSGGGIDEGGQSIFDASGNGMSRSMRTRIVLNYYNGSSWVNCRDSGWIDNGTRQWSHNGSDYGTSPPCGSALYGMKTAAIYWSNTTGQWLGGTWVLSGNLTLGAVFAANTNVPPMPDTPLDLPPPPPTDSHQPREGSSWEPGSSLNRVPNRFTMASVQIESELGNRPALAVSRRVVVQRRFRAY
jgi:hypothetical protein